MGTHINTCLQIHTPDAFKFKASPIFIPDDESMRVTYDGSQDSELRNLSIIADVQMCL